MMQILYLTALIPVVHFILAHYFAKKDNILSKLKKNYAIMYLDWLFIFVNISLVLNNSFGWLTFLLFFVLCLIPILHLKKGWRDSKQKRKETTLFFTASGKLNRVGISHAIFMFIQGSLSLQFFFSHATSLFYLLGLTALLIYFVAYCIIIKYVRKLRFVQKVEMPYVILGLILVIGRFIWALHELTII